MTDEETTRRLESKLDRIIAGQSNLERLVAELGVHIDRHATDLEVLKGWQREELEKSGIKEAEISQLKQKCDEQQTQIDALKRLVYIGVGMATLIGATGALAAFVS